MHTPHATYNPISGIVHQPAPQGAVTQPPREPLAYASPPVLVVQTPAPRRSSGELVAIIAVVGVLGLFAALALLALLAALAVVAAVVGFAALTATVAVVALCR